MENGDRAASRGRAAPGGLCGCDRVLRRGARCCGASQRRRRAVGRRSARCGCCRRVRLVARARGPLRELQPDGVAQFGSAARFSFVYCGAGQISRCFSRRDCDGRDRDGGRRATLVPRLRGRRARFRALREASNASRRTAKSAAGAAGLRVLSHTADACGSLMLIICTHYLTTTQQRGAATKAGYPSRSPLNGFARARGLAELSATAASDTSRRRRPWRPMPGNIKAAARPGQQGLRREWPKRRSRGD